MKPNFKLLSEELECKLKQCRPVLTPDTGAGSTALTGGRRNMTVSSVKKMLDHLKGKYRLSADTKNLLALLAGFQTWKDLEDALHGDADAGLNYDPEDKP